MMSLHFKERLLQRFDIYWDDMTEKKILMAIAQKKVEYVRRDDKTVTFRTVALGKWMNVTMSYKGCLVTCDLPVNAIRRKK